MKKIIPFCMIVLLACNDNKQSEVNKDLDSAGATIDKAAKDTKETVNEAVEDIKKDSTVKKIGNKLKDIGDRIKSK